MAAPVAMPNGALAHRSVTPNVITEKEVFGFFKSFSRNSTENLFECL